ncbi:hypothetical protein [Antarcticirhabdus aurantiaca]|uniref:Uncharacterized protein n=1 Tax=Antarcticirhabdus aurantiaca TaxID=2606717 RepID=A0ACD4NQ89_9HYPH|nr:hypothetical protein [Antarcticirhabdus aurantiaca]WAJ28939.1 hypothetical protein OXU80_01400 [Jeongeuplla avenae]
MTGSQSPRRQPTSTDGASDRTLKLYEREDATHREFAGTKSEVFNTRTLHQACESVWYGGTAPNTEAYDLRALHAAGAMANIAPTDALEGMLAAQMVATHNAAMECFRRAMIEGQTFQGREQNLAHASKLTRSYATLVQALDKHRGKGQQTVRVEHVHVHAGGQAIVGPVTHGSSMEVAPAAIGKSEEVPVVVEGAEEIDAALLATGGSYGR